MQNQTQAYLYAAVTVLFWSTVATAFKLSLRHVGPDVLVFYSSAVSVAVLLCITLATGRLGQLREWNIGDLRISLGLGFLNPFLYYLVLFKAYDLLPAQEALTLNFTWPMVLALFSILLLRQPIGTRAVAAMAISFAGVALIATRGDPLGLDLASPRGVALALGSTLIWTLYWIYGVKGRPRPGDAAAGQLRVRMRLLGRLPVARGHPGDARRGGAGRRRVHRHVRDGHRLRRLAARPQALPHHPRRWASSST